MCVPGQAVGVGGDHGESLEDQLTQWWVLAYIQEQASPRALWETPALSTLGDGVCVKGRRWLPHQLPIDLL